MKNPIFLKTPYGTVVVPAEKVIMIADASHPEQSKTFIQLDGLQNHMATLESVEAILDKVRGARSSEFRYLVSDGEGAVRPATPEEIAEIEANYDEGPGTLATCCDQDARS